MVSWSQFPPEIKRKIAENYDFMSRCENSPDLADSIQKFIPSTLPLNEGLLILKSLLAHESIQISTMEWEIQRFVTKNESFKLGKQILKLLGKSKFHVKELEFVHNVDDTLLSFFPKICEWKNVEIVRKLAISLYPENMHPVTAHDYHRIGDVVSGKPVCYTHYCTHDPRADSEVFFGIMNGYMKDNGRDKLHWTTHREPSHLAIQGKEHARRRLDPNDENYSLSEDHIFKSGDVNYARGTQCGIWVNRYYGNLAKELKEIHDRETCGIGSVCPKHADPFDYWYYQNLPRRLVQEPFWTGFKCTFSSSRFASFPNITPIDLDNLRRKMRADENRRRQILMKKLNRMKYSWGFGRDKQKASMEFEIPEFMMVKRESRWSTWLKIIFLPILISFFFYAVFY